MLIHTHTYIHVLSDTSSSNSSHNHSWQQTTSVSSSQTTQRAAPHTQSKENTEHPQKTAKALQPQPIPRAQPSKVPKWQIKSFNLHTLRRSSMWSHDLAETTERMTN